MIGSFTRAAALAVCLALVPAAAMAAASPKPLPTPHLPDVALHTQFNVEVNKLGQIVRVKSGKESPNPTFNAQTYGNVLQMWIRTPDGRAIVGMYRVDFDYNPKTHIVSRHVKLLYAGGDWANGQGAANQMLDLSNREAQAAHLKKQEEAAKHLPDINAIIKKDVAKPTASPQP